ncbi:MAG: alpha/beta hydrolase [Opitutaceae bacterium]|jgi:endo-1,4-beta-xylanase
MRSPPSPAAWLALLLSTAAAATAADAPLVVPLWIHGAPGSEARMNEAEVVTMHDANTPAVYNIHNPSLTVYLPAAGKATGAAVIVAPGGGHQFLSYVHEGSAVAEWLSQQGIAGFLLKYRLARDQAGGSTYKVEVDALADAQRSIRLVRSRAAEWGVNPARIGFLGFSAGGELAVLASEHSDAGKPGADDAIERFSSRPDFTCLGYPGIRPETVTITADMPPAFMFSAYDDARTSSTIASLFLKYRAAGVPAEIHIYNRGGHGFGIRNRPMPVSSWPQRLEEWMRDRGFVP